MFRVHAFSVAGSVEGFIIVWRLAGRRSPQRLHWLSHSMASDESGQRLNDYAVSAATLMANQYCERIAKKVGGNIIEAGRTRAAIRQLIGEKITLKPAKDRSHWVAHLQFRQSVPLAGSGGR